MNMLFFISYIFKKYKYIYILALLIICQTYWSSGSSGAYAQTQPKFTLIPTTTHQLQYPSLGQTIVEYNVTNMTTIPRMLTLVPFKGISQNIATGKCSNPFYLLPQTSCTLSILVERGSYIPPTTQTIPQVCKTTGNNNTPDNFLCSQASLSNAITVARLTSDPDNPDFPYGSSPQGNVCVSSDYYATPETMLGSWAMREGISMDATAGNLSSIFTPSNTVYAVGTAALGDQLGLTNCSGGCNQLNGYCFAIRFNDKTNYPYMIFQSVNIGANANSFDIYMAGGGSGAFPDQCRQFWGTDDTINWGNNIENAAAPACNTYFNNFSTINSSYSVTYNNTVHDAKQTLIDACNFASTGQSGFNTQNWSNLSVVPVTCPQSLTQITGLAIPADIKTIGNQTIHDLSSLTTQDFNQSTLTGITTTQMQDCKTPSSGYCNNVSQSVPNYQASISATLLAPILSAIPPSDNYCSSHKTITGFCSWDGGAHTGGDYCNQSQAICYSCGSSSQWCTCNNGELIKCTSQ